MIQAWLLRYWRELAAIALMALACWRGYGWAYDNGKRDCESVWLKKENKALQAAIADNAKANDERREAQKRADKLAALPPKVVERVRANPSGCRIAKPVGDELRRQVAETNAAIRAVP